MLPPRVTLQFVMPAFVYVSVCVLTSKAAGAEGCPMSSPCNSNTSGCCRADIIPRMSEAVSQLRATGWNPITRPLIAQTETARVDDKCVRNTGDGIDQKGRMPPAERSQTALEGILVLVTCIAMGLTRPNGVRQARDSNPRGEWK